MPNQKHLPANNEKPPRAEIIAIGDELTCGQRLDTNSRWLSQKLDDLGVQVAFHTCVGDSLVDIQQAIEVAAGRVDAIVVTGGLGPTADDLTREAIAAALGVPLVLHKPSMRHIQEIFRRHGRDMPERNRVQAMLPDGCEPIDNPEGTAPGIHFQSSGSEGRTCHGWALPGVPAEMKQMWAASVETAIRNQFRLDTVTIHHTLRCFGAGESEIEAMLDGLTARDRYPLVGITASQATISLRVTAKARSHRDAQRQIEPVVREIREKLGELVYGENDQTLQDVVAEMLRQNGQTIACLDYWLGGSVGDLISATAHPEVLTGAVYWPSHRPTDDGTKEGEASLNETRIDDDAQPDITDTPDFKPPVEDRPVQALTVQQMARELDAGFDSDDVLISAASRLAELVSADWSIAISPPKELVIDGESRTTFSVYIGGPQTDTVETLLIGGHSSYRRVRCQKQVLNAIRLALLHHQ